MSALSPRSLIVRKSPKKRTQSEMLSIDNNSMFTFSNGLNSFVDSSNHNNKTFDSGSQINRSLQSDINVEQSAVVHSGANNQKDSLPASATGTSSAASNGLNRVTEKTEEAAAIGHHRRKSSLDAIPSFYVQGNNFTGNFLFVCLLACLLVYLFDCRLVCMF